jgi:outer membrane protein TolC
VITEARNRAGGVSDADVQNRKATVAQTQATIPPLEAQLDVMNHQLAVLMGKSPAEAQIPGSLARRAATSAGAAFEPSLRTGAAAARHSRRRSAVASGQRQRRRGDGQSLSANCVVGERRRHRDQFCHGGDVWNVASSLTQPIYNGGALRAEKRKAEAAYQEADSVYRQTVLHGIAAKRFDAGGISEVNLLDAERQKLQTALDRENAAASRLTDSATLFEALGGSAKGSF